MFQFNKIIHHTQKTSPATQTTTTPLARRVKHKTLESAPLAPKFNLGVNLKPSTAGKCSKPAVNSNVKTQSREMQGKDENLRDNRLKKDFGVILVLVGGAFQSCN